MSKLDKLEEKAIKRIIKLIEEMTRQQFTTAAKIAFVDGVRDQALWRTEVLPMPNPFEKPESEKEPGN